MESFERRLANLENDLIAYKRKTKALAALALVALAFPLVWAGIGQGGQVPSVVRARQFELIGDGGKVITYLRQDEILRGGVLSLLNKEGKSGAELRADGVLGARHVFLTGDNGRAAMLTSDRSGGVFTLFAPGSKPAVKLSVERASMVAAPRGSVAAGTSSATGKLELLSSSDSKVLFKAP